MNIHILNDFKEFIYIIYVFKLMQFLWVYGFRLSI